jgi:hypothetical protein
MFNYWAHWGGLYRPVWLEARSDVHVDSLFVTPDIGKGLARTKVVLKRSVPGKAWEGDVTVAVTPAKGGAESADHTKVRFAEGQSVSEPVVVDVAVKEPHLWSPEDPFLYNVQARVSQDGKPVDMKTDRFGMREITVGKGGTLLLNGAPYFIRGLGDDYIQAVTGTLVPDKSVYLDRIKHVKQYGYNAFRCLAHTPAHEVFDAADELGFLIWAEAPAYWNHWPRINEVVPLYRKMVPQIIKEFGNHPSWYVWSAGNECAENPEWMGYVNDARDTFKSMDPTRLFLASSGIGIAGPSDMVTWHENFEPSRNENLASSQDKPHILHEFPGTYAGSLPNLTNSHKYTGVISRDPCVELKMKEVAEYGLTERYPEIWRRSVDFLQLYLKEEYETARKSPTLDGFNYWLFTDLPGGVEGDPPSLGILNVFYETEKFPDSKPFMQFNREAVILMSAGGADRVLGANETKPLAFSISHYGSKAVKDGKLVWKLADGARVVQEGIIEDVNVAPGEVREVGRIGLAAGSVDQAAKLVLSARLDSSVLELENAWDFWAFPAKKRDFTGSGVANLTGLPEVEARFGNSTIEPGKTRVVIAETLNPEALEFVNAGGIAILLTESGTIQKPIIMPLFWANSIRSVGYVVEDAPAMKDFPHDGTFSFQFFRLFGANLEAMDLTARDSLERAAFTPIVWAFMPDFDPSLPGWTDPRGRTKLFRCGIINEGRIGKGRIITCSLRVLTGIRHGFPEAGYLLDCLVDHALSDKPASRDLPALTADEALKLFKIE